MKKSKAEQMRDLSEAGKSVGVKRLRDQILATIEIRARDGEFHFNTHADNESDFYALASMLRTLGFRVERFTDYNYTFVVSW